MSPNLRAFAELPDETDSSDGFALLYTREHHRKRSIQDGRLYRHGRGKHGSLFPPKQATSRC